MRDDAHHDHHRGDSKGADEVLFMQGGNWSAADRMQVVRRCAPYRLCMGCKSEVGEHPGKVSQALHIGVYVQWKGFPMPVKHKDNLSERHEAVVAAAKATASLLYGANSPVSARAA
jgi:hypothetical protein